MTPDALADAMRTLGWGVPDLAQRVPCSVRAVRRWLAGSAPIPDAVARWVADLAQRAAQGPDGAGGENAP
jgi:ribosome-binding protein aMBF1 (putative translation factor)